MTNDNFELEEMRQQMAILKQKLHQQEIVVCSHQMTKILELQLQHQSFQ